MLRCGREQEMSGTRGGLGTSSKHGARKKPRPCFREQPSNWTMEPGHQVW